MFVYSVQIISRLDDQSKFQMVTPFRSRHIGILSSTPTWRPHTGLYKFVYNVFDEYLKFGITYGAKTWRGDFFNYLL